MAGWALIVGLGLVRILDVFRVLRCGVIRGVALFPMGVLGYDVCSSCLLVVGCDGQILRGRDVVSRDAVLAWTGHSWESGRRSTDSVAGE